MDSSNSYYTGIATKAKVKNRTLSPSLRDTFMYTQLFFRIS